MEERILDLRLPNEERMKEVQRTTQLLYEINNLAPFSSDHDKLIKQLFTGGIEEGSHVSTPLYMNIAKNLHIGKHVFINSYFKCMSAGEIYIEDHVQIAMGVSIITNNHDEYERSILTIKDVHIKKNAWIGANAILLPGITIGENAIVGAGSVVTRSVPANTVVAGNPAKVIRSLDGSKFK